MSGWAKAVLQQHLGIRLKLIKAAPRYEGLKYSRQHSPNKHALDIKQPL